MKVEHPSNERKGPVVQTRQQLSVYCRLLWYGCNGITSMSKDIGIQRVQQTVLAFMLALLQSTCRPPKKHNLYLRSSTERIGIGALGSRLARRPVCQLLLRTRPGYRAACRCSADRRVYELITALRNAHYTMYVSSQRPMRHFFPHALPAFFSNHLPRFSAFQALLPNLCFFPSAVFTHSSVLSQPHLSFPSDYIISL